MNRSIELKSIISQNKDIDVSELDGQKVMMNIDIGKYFMMNEVGSVIWDFIEESKSVEGIINHLLSVYDVGEEACRSSVISYLEKLHDSEIIEIA